MRRRLFPLAAAALALAAVEAGSWVLFRVRHGPFSYGDVAAARHRRLEPQEAAAGDPARPWMGDRAARETLHPFIGIVLGPRRGEPAVAGSLADLGFHEGMVPTTRDPGEVVVLLVGGSVAEAFGRASGPFLARLAEAPALAGRRPRLLNAALAGHKPPQQLAAATYLLALGVPIDMVVALDGFNDVVLPGAENVPRGLALSYTRQWNVRAGDLDDAGWDARAEVRSLRKRQERAARRLDAFPWRLSVTASLLWTSWDEHLESRVAAIQVAAATARRGAGASPRLGPRLGTPQDLEAVSRESAAIWSRSSRLLAGVCAAAGASFHHSSSRTSTLPARGGG